VKQIARSTFQTAKTLGTIDVSRLSMHANITRSQAALERNCALSMAADLFTMMVDLRFKRDADAAKLTC
jgi:hypothetical protein